MTECNKTNLNAAQNLNWSSAWILAALAVTSKHIGEEKRTQPIPTETQGCGPLWPTHMLTKIQKPEIIDITLLVMNNDKVFIEIKISFER